MQKEAYFFKVPCVTLRDSTEWMETVENEWNVLAEADKEKIIDTALKQPLLSDHSASRNIYDNGKTAERIVEILTGHR